MPNKKFGQFDPAGALSDSDIIPIEQAGITKRTTQGDLKAAIIGAPSLPIDLTADTTVTQGANTLYFDASGAGVKMWPSGDLGVNAASGQADNGFGLDVFNSGVAGYLQAGGLTIGNTGLVSIDNLAVGEKIKNSDYTVTDQDMFLLGNAASGDMTFTLPDVTTIGNQVLIFKKYDGTVNTVSIVPFTNTQFIDGATSVILANQYDWVLIVADPVRQIWHIVAQTGSQAGAVWGSITGTLSDQTDLQAALDSKAAILSPIRTGGSIAFDAEAVYGTTSSPITANITYNATGAKIGVTQLIIHNNGSEPTFGVQYHKLSGSGSYVTGQLNFIYCNLVDTGYITYTISQAA